MEDLTPEEEKLLTKLNNYDIQKIDFQVTSQGVTYPDIKDIVEEYNPIIFNRLLTSLTDKGYLEETGHQMFIFCPKCNSLDVYTKYKCPQCKSTDITRKDFIEHPHCGYIDQKSKFEKEFRYVCPNCETDLGPMGEKPQESGKESYTVLGSSFTCNNCEQNFEKPNLIHQCQNCGANFSYKQSRYQKISSYKKTQKALQLSPANEVQQIKKDIQKILEERDIEGRINATLMGESEGEHKFDVIGKSKPGLIVGDISVENAPEDLISLFGKRTDVHAGTEVPIFAFLIDLSHNEKVQKMEDVYDIKTIKTGENFQKRFKEYLNTILEK